MHDLVHDLASTVLKETSPVRYMYLKSMKDISEGDARNLRSLIFEGKDSSNMMFSNLNFLRGLVLIGEDNKELPKVENLLHLRYLDISASRIESLSDSIGDLYHLQTLRASNALKKLPKTLNKLISLRHLYICSLEHEDNKIEEIPMLWQLPHLKSLILQGLPNVRCIGSLLDGIHYNSVGKEKIVVFPALETLRLVSMSSMTELIATGETQLSQEQEVLAFPCLEQLWLSECRKLTSGPSHLPCLKDLKIKGMDSSLFLDNLLVNLTLLRELTIDQVQGLVCFPDEFFCNNKSLSELAIRVCLDLTRLAPSFGASLREIEIGGCRRLKELPEDLLSLDSLVILKITNCENLKSIPCNPQQTFPPLRTLFIQNCNLLAEVPIGMLESSAPSLEVASFTEVNSLRNIGAVIGCLQKMPRLTGLGLDFKITPELSDNSFPMDIGSFPNLHNLYIECGMENWERVQEQIRHLTALRKLTLTLLEIEALPEWLGELPSLEHLNLLYCDKLKSLPSKNAMKHLTILRITKCPSLNVKKDDPLSERHKISQATHVRVN